MPSFVFFEKDESIHKELIQMTYKSWLSDDYNNDLIRIILKDSKKVRVKMSIFKLFSSSFSSLLSANSSDNSVILLPDFDEKCLNFLIDILTEGTTTAKAFINPSGLDEVKEIKCLAQCLGVDVSNLVVIEQNQKIQPMQSFRIKTFSHVFNYAEVPNILLDATKGNNDDEEDVTDVDQLSPNLLETISSDDEEALMDYSQMMAEEALVINEDDVNVYDDEQALVINEDLEDSYDDDEALVINEDLVNAYATDPRPSSGGETKSEASTNQTKTRTRTWTRWGPELDNNNRTLHTIDKEDSSPSFVCEECIKPKTFKSSTDLNNHKIALHSGWNCDECSEEFHNLADISNHKIKKHPNNMYNIPCVLCKVNCTSSNNLGKLSKKQAKNA